jgi:hypothetical protein
MNETGEVWDQVQKGSKPTQGHECGGSYHLKGGALGRENQGNLHWPIRKAWGSIHMLLTRRKSTVSLKVISWLRIQGRGFEGMDGFRTLKFWRDSF